MVEEIKKTQEVLRKGGVILYPSDTCWAIGCDATNVDAVKRLSLIINRKGPFVSIIPTADWLSTYVVKVPDIAWDLVEFAEKPLTVVFEKGKNICPEVMGENGSVALRVVMDKFCKDLLMRFQKPIVATLVRPNALRWETIPEEIKQLVDYSVPLRKEDKTLPLSTIMSLKDGGEFKFIRKS